MNFLTVSRVSECLNEMQCPFETRALVSDGMYLFPGFSTLKMLNMDMFTARNILSVKVSRMFFRQSGIGPVSKEARDLVGNFPSYSSLLHCLQMSMLHSLMFFMTTSRSVTHFDDFR